MDQDIRIQIRKYLKGKISSDACECCGKERLIVIDGVCIWCLKLIISYLQNQFGERTTVIQHQPKLRPIPTVRVPGRVVRMTPEEVEEMSSGAHKVKPKQGFEWIDT